jgi:hypothetical protein
MSSRSSAAKRPSSAITELAFDIDVLDSRSSHAHSTVLSKLPATVEQLKAVADAKAVRQMLDELCKLGCATCDDAGLYTASAKGAAALSFYASNQLARSAIERTLQPPSYRAPCVACNVITTSRCAKCRVIPLCSSHCRAKSDHAYCVGEFEQPKFDGGYLDVIDMTKEKEVENHVEKKQAPLRRPRGPAGAGRGRGRKAMRASYPFETDDWDV